MKEKKFITLNDVKKLSGIFNYDYTWTLFDYELFEQRTSNKEYSSIDSSKKAYNSIVEKINKFYDKLNRKDDNQ